LAKALEMSLERYFDVAFPLNHAIWADLGKMMDFAGFGGAAKMIRKIIKMPSFPLNTFDCPLRSQVSPSKSMISPRNSP
jgi:hypothetical protein